MEDRLMLKNLKSGLVVCHLKWSLPSLLASFRGLRTMPEGRPSALHRDPMGEECAQLRSPLSACVHPPPCADPHPYGHPRLCRAPREGPGRRPVSLVSTLSSDSSRDGLSLFGSTATLQPPSSSSTTPPPCPSEEDVDLRLSPSQGNGVQGRRQSPCRGAPWGQWAEQREGVVLGSQRNYCHAERTCGRGGVGVGGPSYSQSSPVAADAMAPNPELSYVDRVVMEIIETERMYVRDLRSIVEDYLAQIIDAGDLPILPEQVCALFGNIDDIYVFNSELLQSLDLCENDPVAIARCFVDKSEYFVIYTQYCTNYPNSVVALTDCMRSKTLAKFFRDRQASLKRSLPLGSYLLKPVQRILKYHLLLEEIARHYDPEEIGYEVIQEAIDTMTGVAWYINDMKRKHEHAVRLQEIQSLLINWKGTDLTTYGELVLEGSFHVPRAKNSRTLFLFQRTLLITKKRGEHYVYKIDISCSTLMLLDSAKDPLTFSVIHFKHPKQLHTVQAKSVEEKRLWASHIRRLILENHNTIPKTAQETFLEMDSVCAGRYRYSPERQNKVGSYQADDFAVAGRPERRRSEPAKQIVRSTKAFLKHADSEGTLLGDLCSLQPASSVSTLASSVGEPQAEGPGVEEEDVEEHSPKRHSLEQLCPSDVDPKLGSAPSERGLEEKAQRQREEEVEVVEEEEEGDCYKEDILMGDDQDVQNMDAENMDAAEEQDSRTGDVLETSTQDVPSEKAEDNVHYAQVKVEEPSSPRREEEPEVDSMLMEVNHSHLPESPTSAPLSAENPDPVPDIQEHLEVSLENGEETAAESDGSCLPGDGSTLSFGEYSEEDEEMPVGRESVLPPSVSDGAGVIAEHLTSSGCRRSSLVASEDPERSAGPSPPPEGPRPPDESSFCSELREEEADTSDNASPEPRPAAEASRPVAPAAQEAAPPEDSLDDVERRSTLSKQDRLLIHKIRRYYENQDASAGVKRRESLSYIPAGLVRHLSKQLNSTPRADPTPVHRKGSSPSRPTSWAVFDLPGLEKRPGAEPAATPRRQRSVEARPLPPSVGDASAADDGGFRPSSDMLKMWNDMELGMNGCPEELPVIGPSDEEIRPDPGSEHRISGHMRSETLGGCTRERTLHILEECEAELLSEHSSTSATTSPLTGSEGEYAEDPWLSTAPRCGGNGRVARAPLPRIISLRSGVEDDQILQDMGKVKNKVFQLARQYSQRIKNNRPLIRPRNRDSENPHGLKSMPAVHEESMPSWENGEHTLTYPLNTCDQVNAVDEPPTPPADPSPGPSSRATTPQAVSSPSSPSRAPSLPSSPVDSEPFHWPDVHQLCSRYTGPRSGPGAGPPLVGRSCSVPERMLELCTGGPGRPPWSPTATQPLTPRPPWDSAEGQWGGGAQRRGSPTREGGGSRLGPRLLCRWGSLDSVPAAASRPLHELQNLQDPVRPGHGTLPAQHKVKEGTTAGSDVCLKEAQHGVFKRPAAPHGNKKTENRIVRNLREKFQSLGSGS
ncbi:pleckstrin homology domain-containing family G member 3 isoform X2 [Gadus macrocephalus]|uniref:pleckstrin homology domain-containing family G member 3 isoform X2 n=1 Tax=Gadus macrocephalus TaxID=80720 RepID=UPI0028CBBBE7|nr:pleckstrin homology domain-containing family G member 3 isoform X2 [Gadus macrocephalus]